MKIQFLSEPHSRLFSKAFLIFDTNSTGEMSLSTAETAYMQKQLKENNIVIINRYNELILIALTDNTKGSTIFLEQCRKRGNEIAAILKREQLSEINLIIPPKSPDGIIALAEGLSLGSYQFLKYKSANQNADWSLERICFVGTEVTPVRIDRLSTLITAVFMARNLVNEPASHLNAVKLSQTFENMGNEAGFTTDILGMDKIKELKMGGILAVNQGSANPPTFSILSWRPADAKNEKPIILVGKGVVYDTGGLSLKPTKDSMDYMKCDMAGGAVAASVIWFAAKCRLPVYLIALVPSTDNRVDSNAYSPGDVIFMHGGQSVEVMNTDAEGRLLLADALSFAKDYQPELVIDIATLTGSAAMAIGNYGIVGMGTAGQRTFDSLKKSGEKVYERIVEFPLWDEYGESIKSDIADMKNIGAREGGAISAGKFLEKFVGYPWIHLDIAGPAFLSAADQYRTKGGTAYGVRLLIDFLTNFD